MLGADSNTSGGGGFGTRVALARQPASSRTMRSWPESAKTGETEYGNLAYLLLHSLTLRSPAHPSRQNDMHAGRKRDVSVYSGMCAVVRVLVQYEV